MNPMLCTKLSKSKINSSSWHLVYQLRASTWWPVDWDFLPSRVILKTLKIVFAAFAPGAQHKRKCEGFCVCVVRHVISLNSVQSFVIEICNGPSIENSLKNVCLHSLSCTFTFTCGIKPKHGLSVVHSLALG